MTLRIIALNWLANSRKPGTGWRLMKRFVVWSTLLSLLFAVPAAGEPDRAELDEARGRLLSILLENIVPFWYPQTVDAEYGGYHLNHDERGDWLGPAGKGLVTQARMVWFFARLHNEGYGAEEYLEAARVGFEFMRDRMWDRVFGGFFWEMDTTGRIGTKPHKHLYGQAFALYALSEYIEATRDTSAVRLAGELFELLETRAHDGEFGGYREWFRRDWEPGPTTVAYMGHTPDGKLMNTHLHLMEAFTAYYLVTGDELIRERLLELIAVQSNAVVRKDLGACTDKYERDWTPVLVPEFARVSYGHDVENVWLLAEACQAAGLSSGPFADLYRQLMAYSLGYGFDSVRGGFYESGGFGEPADSRNKVWWTQAEGLVATLYMYYLTGEELYYDAFSLTLDWIDGHQADWENGDWHATVGEDGSLSGGKAHVWKSPYHNGRAMLQCLRILTALSEMEKE